MATPPIPPTPPPAPDPNAPPGRPDVVLPEPLSAGDDPTSPGLAPEGSHQKEA